MAKKIKKINRYIFPISEKTDLFVFFFLRADENNILLEYRFWFSRHFYSFIYFLGCQVKSARHLFNLSRLNKVSSKIYYICEIRVYQ